MKIKNTYTSHIGFGNVKVLPGETAVLPEKYGNSSVLEHYKKRGMIEIIDEKQTPKAASGGAAHLDPTVVSAFDYEKYQDEDYHTTYNTAGIHPLDPYEQKAKAISRMSLNELKDHARQIGVEFADTDTRNALIDKIKAVHGVTAQDSTE